ncbi:CLOCK-interacting pacemaker [Neoarius graeffei]|uniref:CLOCK-interacting pacemaker n=1 Tax=Neoarius graeffei TaxID=443677 RepID=UPI00298CC520|nr:CLOCK-interacting pacemaker [Neoarius graeffei]XP_060773770.1 CLOCK-interacting pacemaker [Neoarius graeffei]XP_060773771.1 CLOCK-interacting pacemaker [Neoarius graeffei]XP_060773772.1 CLOCK-interacting pacemaker [Neoarius graeffei]XP_060773773.1 CLOCK-interacting pacemaker [Neoarius graeffei]
MSMKMKDDGLVTTMGKSKTKRMEKSKPDSERDSGFSDASSEHLSIVDQTDIEDAARPAMQAVSGSRSQTSQLAVIGGSFQRLSPMIIMNNVLLKQPGDNPSSVKSWGFSPSVEVVQQPQVVFLQPVISQRAASEPKGPPSKRRKHKKYLPILKSYPKIAPHPGDSPRSSCTSSSSSSCSTVTASVKSSSSSSSSWDPLDPDKQQAVQTSSSSSSFVPNPMTPTRHRPSSPQPHTPPTDSNTGSCLGVEEPMTEPTEMPAKTLQTQPQATFKDDLCQNGDSDSNEKRKRFCNTYNVLSKSGLLDITLRTKELIRQNRRTQAELDQLREHTNLFMEALQTGDLCIYSKLQMSMQEESATEKTVMNTGSERQMDHLK